MKRFTFIRNRYLIFLGSIVVLGLVRLIPILKQPLYTFGYDYGFYYGALSRPLALNWQNFFGAILGSYTTPLFFVFQKLNFSPEVFLNVSLYTMSLLVGAGFFFLFRKNFTAGILSILLVAFSIAQTEVYTMFLWKNVLGLIVLLIALGFALKRQWSALSISLVILLLSHRTSFIVLSLTLVLYFLFVLLESGQHKRLAFVLLGSGIIIILTQTFWLPQLKDFINHPNSSVVEGIFIDPESFVTFTWPLFVLGLGGFAYSLKKPEYFLIHA